MGKGGRSWWGSQRSGAAEMSEAGLVRVAEAVNQEYRLASEATTDV